MDRRTLFRIPFCLGAGALLGRPGGAQSRGSAATARLAAADEAAFTREASWYKKRDGLQVECLLCPRHCLVSDQENGWCGIRANDRGTYYTHTFGRPVSIANDPIEKKPLFHYLPGSETLSLATVGCNFECSFCQNWEISQFRPEQVPARWGFVSPQDLADKARQLGSRSMAFTYSEPVVWFEYALAAAKASKAAGLPGVLISNGWIEPGPMEELLAVLGAVKIDFKAYSEEFYKKNCRGTLKPVLETMKLVRKKGIWLEMVHLTIPTLNDSEDQTKSLCDWILQNLGPDVPLHFTRFHPTFKLKNLPPTPPSTLERQWEQARRAGLHYVYVGNLPGHQGENTVCAGCGELAIKRVGFTVVENRLKGGKCPKCGQAIPGVWG